MAERSELEQQQGVSQRKGNSFEGLSLVNFSVYMVVWTVALYGLLALIEASSSLWRPLSIFLYSVLIVVISIISFGVLVQKVADNGKIEREAPIGLAWVLLSVPALLVAFSQMSKQLYLLYGGFVATQTGYWHWLRWGVDQALDNVLFDIPSIYGWNITEIHPIVFWSRTIVFLLNIELELIVIAALVRQFQLVRESLSESKTPKTPKTLSHTNYMTFIFNALGKLLLLGCWLVPTLIALDAIVRDQLVLESLRSVARFGLLTILGAWLGWYSLRALALHGIWNKLCALGGILIGIWLLYANVPAFFMFIRL